MCITTELLFFDVFFLKKTFKWFPQEAACQWANISPYKDEESNTTIPITCVHTHTHHTPD